MKKHLLAAAVAAAVAAPAMAQNVTLYGVFDASMSSSDTGAAGASNALNVTDSSIESSRFGIRGDEDLGGGLKALFALEGDVSIANGRTRTDNGINNVLIGNVGNADAMFRRAAYAGLASNTWGELTLGRRVNPAISNSQGLSVMAGNSVGTANQAAQGTAQNFFTREAVTYVTPSFNGASLTIQQGIAGGLVDGTAGAATQSTQQPATVRGTAAGYKVTAFALNYGNGPITAGIATSTVNNAAGATDHEFTNARIHYKLDNWTFGYGFQDVQVGNAATVFTRPTTGPGPNVSNRSSVYSIAYQLRASTTLGATLIQNDKVGSLTNLQARESLSKSTSLYAQYGRSKADVTASTTANFVSSWGSQAAPADGQSATTLSLGIIKAF